jgi:hypothetical protein
VEQVTRRPDKCSAIRQSNSAEQVTRRPDKRSAIRQSAVQITPHNIKRYPIPVSVNR